MPENLRRHRCAPTAVANFHCTTPLCCSVNGSRYTLMGLLSSTQSYVLPSLSSLSFLTPPSPQSSPPSSPLPPSVFFPFPPSPSSPLPSPSPPSSPAARSAPEVCYDYNTVGNCYGKCSIQQPCGSACRQIPCAQEYVAWCLI